MERLDVRGDPLLDRDDVAEAARGERERAQQAQDVRHRGVAGRIGGFGDGERAAGDELALVEPPGREERLCERDEAHGDPRVRRAVLALEDRRGAGEEPRRLIEIAGRGADAPEVRQRRRQALIVRTD